MGGPLCTGSTISLSVVVVSGLNEWVNVENKPKKSCRIEKGGVEVQRWEKTEERTECR